MILIDSTFLIDILNGKENAKIKLDELEKRDIALCTSQINVFEIIQGIYTYGKKIDEELVSFEALLHDLEVLDLSYFAAYTAGKIGGELRRKGINVASSDILISAIAIVNGVDTIITQNHSDFLRIPGIKVERYWKIKIKRT